MKKIISLFLVLIIAFGASACGANKNQKTICEGEVDGTQITYTLTHDGKEVYQQETTIVTDLTGYDFADEDLDELIKEFAAMYDIKGVEYTYDYKDKVLTEKINVDYTVADFKDLAEVELIESTNDEAVFIGYDITVEGAEDEGLTCKLQK